MCVTTEATAVVEAHWRGWVMGGEGWEPSTGGQEAALKRLTKLGRDLCGAEQTPFP